MTKSIRNLLVTILSCILVAVLSMGMVSLAKADTTVIRMTGTAEANVQSEDKSGLRFSATIDKSEFSTLTEGKDARVGMMIVPTDHLEVATLQGHEFTIASLSEYEPFDGYAFYDYARTVKDNGDEYQFWMTVPKISGANYNRDFSARAFIEITEEAGVSYVYADYDAQYARNVYDVAYKAYTDGVIEDQTSKDIAKSFIDGVAVLEYDEDNGVVIANNKGDYLSPYAIEEDDRGNKILVGSGLSALTYNGERKTDYKTSDDFDVYVPQRGSIAEINTGRMAMLTTYASGLNSTTTHAFQYIGWEGEYGVGTYLDFEFSGNNMPQVMFFADSIDGYMVAGASGADTSSMRKGVIVMSGAVTERYDRMYVIGPNRVRTDPASYDYNVYGFADGAPHYAKLTLYGYTTNSYTGTTYPLLTQKGLMEAGEDKSYKYTVGTYEAENGKLGLHIILTYADGEAIYEIKEATTLNLSEVTASNIVVYPPIKGAGTSTFKFSAPYSLDLKYSSAATFAEDGSVTLTTYTSGLTSTTTHAFQYIGWKGKYGVGTYLDFEFSGNNMPQVMFFADSIDGYMCAGKSGTDTSSMRKGVIVMSGTSSERLNRMYVIGPNRVRTDQTASDQTTTYAFSDGAPLHAKLTLYGETTTSYTGITYPLLTQKGLTEAGEEKSYKYTIGTYEAENEKLGIHIILTYADGTPIYDIKEATTLNVSDLTADNIVVYPPIKGSGTSTFKFSAPYTK